MFTERDWVRGWCQKRILRSRRGMMAGERSFCSEAQASFTVGACVKRLRDSIFAWEVS
jgi:hypothetical protein